MAKALFVYKDSIGLVKSVDREDIARKYSKGDKIIKLEILDQEIPSDWTKGTYGKWFDNKLSDCFENKIKMG